MSSERIKLLREQQVPDLKHEIINLLNVDNIFQATLKMVVLLERQTELKTLETQEEYHNCKKLGCSR